LPTEPKWHPSILVSGVPQEGKTMNVDPGILVRLRDSGKTLAAPEQDVRGRTVRDCDGNEIGTVGDLLIDPAQRKVRLLQVEHDGLFGVGTGPMYIPAETVERVTDGDVHVDRTRVQVATAPEYDPDLTDSDRRMTDLYDYYGCPPYWAPELIPPPSGLFR
jgi:sporulation protein YlmC with PRC-barrel domain